MYTYLLAILTQRETIGIPGNSNKPYRREPKNENGWSATARESREGRP